LLPPSFIKINETIIDPSNKTSLEKVIGKTAYFLFLSLLN
jgi:hypothetical protein